jgi:hypothetical protein
MKRTLDLTPRQWTTLAWILEGVVGVTVDHKVWQTAKAGVREIDASIVREKKGQKP